MTSNYRQGDKETNVNRKKKQRKVYLITIRKHSLQAWRGSAKETELSKTRMNKLVDLLLSQA